MGVHVSPRGKKWAVRRSGRDHALRICATKSEAVNLAIATRETVYVHDADGMIEIRISAPRVSDGEMVLARKAMIMARL